MRGIYLVTDRGLCRGRLLLDVVAQAVKGGAACVQLREKKMPTRAFVEEALAVKNILAPHRIPLMINDRIDVALACGADGVHIG
ncbi:MAG TPA: thiamine phosphate synthase, partial [Smithellaceae bacterium]|nr:thiamine phosphate synthase [Smithellaceae bacterium]